MERFNQTVQAILAKAVEDDQKDWDLHLPQALLAYRTVVQESTGFTPFRLTFRHSPKLPIDNWIGLGNAEEDRIRSYPDIVQKVHKRLVESYSRVRKRLAASHQKQKSTYGRKNGGECFAVGDRVWLFVPAMKKGRTKKLASLWRGPYTILGKTSSVNYRIQLIGGAGSLVVHRNHLKLCYGEPKLLPRKSRKTHNLLHQDRKKVTCRHHQYLIWLWGNTPVPTTCREQKLRPLRILDQDGTGDPQTGMEM